MCVCRDSSIMKLRFGFDVAQRLSNCTLTRVRVKKAMLGERTDVLSPVVVRHSACVIVSHVPHNIITIVPAEENGIVDLWESRCLLNG